MLFHTVAFAIFFPCVFAAYVALRRHRQAQNALLLAASYLFYGWWDWRFLFLIVGSTLVDFVVAKRIVAEPDDRTRRRWLMLSLFANLGTLGVFKYFDFFARSFAETLATVGVAVQPFTLGVILPVGISFYTFQTLSYTIDVYRRELEPSDSLLEVATFVAFFPQLVAGPIERAAHLLPQFAKARQVTASGLSTGLSLVVWGLFKKMVLADNAARLADPIFQNTAGRGGHEVAFATLAFALQIYGDFSGYSDIARGTARILGFDLRLNFALPYVSRDPSEFWRRWHISLSSWLRDYLYIPLGGNRRGTTSRNLLITMLLGGLWHGARWNFVLWGAYHGVLLVGYRALRLKPAANAPVSLLRWALFFVLTLYGWLLFRAATFADIAALTSGVASWSRGPRPDWAQLGWLWLPLVAVHVAQLRFDDLAVFDRLGRARGVVLASMVVAIALFGVREQNEFIYFQF
jgi:alginate O-acetyltransferase complex protein AlgI